MQTRGTLVHREPMFTANSGPDGRPDPARLVSIPKIDECLPHRGIGFHCGLLFRIDSQSRVVSEQPSRLDKVIGP
jgi:hypothetical protein